MKRTLLFLLIYLFYNMHGYTQGIAFEHGTWAEVVAKAKKSNKPVFIDVYTAWCGPCKVMAKNIFPDRQVGDKFNGAFINYKIDAEKGEGIGIAKKYEVKAFPTFLFISPDDLSVIHREAAALPVSEFIGLADMALQKGGYAAKGKSSDEYKQTFDAGERAPTFLLAYMKQNGMEKKPNGWLADTLFAVLPPEKRMQQPYIENLSLNVGSVLSPLFGFLARHYKEINKTINPGDQVFFESAMIGATRAISSYKGKPDPVIPQRMGLFREMISYQSRYVESYYYAPLGRYYKNMHDTSGFLALATEYANAILLKMTKEELEQADKDAIAEVQSKLTRGEVDSIYFKARTRNLHVNVEQGSIRTANLAFDVARTAKTQKDRELAEKLMDHAIAINPSINNEIQLAAVQYLTGKQDIARQTLNKTIARDQNNENDLLQRFNMLIKNSIHL